VRTGWRLAERVLATEDFFCPVGRRIAPDANLEFLGAYLLLTRLAKLFGSKDMLAAA
jgi:hypothetical protein